MFWITLFPVLFQPPMLSSLLLVNLSWPSLRMCEYKQQAVQCTYANNPMPVLVEARLSSLLQSFMSLAT